MALSDLTLANLESQSQGHLDFGVLYPKGTYLDPIMLDVFNKKIYMGIQWNLHI